MKSEVIRTRLIAEFILALVLVFPTLGVNVNQRSRAKRNHSPSIESFTSTKDEIDLCPLSDICSSSGTIATLEVKANDLDNNPLTYKYSVTGGAIIGSGASIKWDLSGSRIGVQRATVEVTDGHGGQVSRSTAVNVVVCGSCDFPCSALAVTCPSTIDEGGVAVFVAHVSGGSELEALKYLWRHSNGQRIPGQEGPELRIKAIGLPGEVITATVRVLGFDPTCNSQASCASTIARKAR